VRVPRLYRRRHEAAFGGALNLRGSVPAAAAAERIADGLARDEALIAFPASTFLLSALLAALPHGVRDVLARTGAVAELRYAR